MAYRTRFARAPLALAAALVAGAGCAHLEAVLYEPGGRAPRSALEGEVRSVDTRNARIQLRSTQGGTVTLYYDGRTTVHFGPARYQPSGLERGDLVRVWASHDRGGALWADRVDVHRTRVQRFDGTVVGVDFRRGSFLVQQGRDAPVRLHVPPHASRSDFRRYERLRHGERVRLEVRFMPGNEGELVRFR